MLKIEKIELSTGHICCGAGGDVFGAKAAGATPLWAFDFNHAASEFVNERIKNWNKAVEEFENLKFLIC